MGTQNTCLNLWERNYLQLYANEISLSGSKTSCCLSGRPSCKGMINLQAAIHMDIMY